MISIAFEEIVQRYSHQLFVTFNAQQNQVLSALLIFSERR
jgi:hypothetical protein